MPEGAAGGSPWAADGPAGAWWRGDPAAAAARFAALDRPSVPPVPPAPIITLTPTTDPAVLADSAPPPVEASVEASIEGEPPAGAPAPAAEPQATTSPEADAEPAESAPTPAEAAAKPADAAPADVTATGDDDEAASGDATGAAHSPAPDLAAPDLAAPEPATPAPEEAMPLAVAEPGDAEPTDTASEAGLDHDAALEHGGRPGAARDAGTQDDEAIPDAARRGEAPQGAALPEPSAAEPSAAEPSAAEASATESSAAEPSAAEPSAAQPSAAEADAAEASIVEAPAAAGAEAAAAAVEPEVEVADDAGGNAADDGAAEAHRTAPAQRPVPTEDAAGGEPGRLWRVATPTGAPNRHERAAEAAKPARAEEGNAGKEHTQEHTRETVVLPPMPDRALIPTPSPAPDDDLPFWLPTHEVPRRDRPSERRRPPKPPRSPAVGLVGLVALALLATFFAWVSAEPLWLAVGHGDTGTATVSECTGRGVGQRCVGEFTAASGAFTAEGVRLVGVADAQSAAGSTVTARMVGADSGRAYVGDAAAVRHLRWALGLVLVVLCGFGLVWVTGARRLEDRWSRRTATLAALTAPLLVTVAFLAATF